ncbi:hypothetical protein PCASD_25183 [Puccinia coronata f. sp. avenae]|uniref:Uncharacterized protein n=1 Tax=Puccinia coronata f. sp. avenae TaxID=200324 RepID=A0A2N5SJ86_9BASI|nr:hypothetical protein PCASD_25183 [Puccinia coronata f. sp. avenae]
MNPSSLATTILPSFFLHFLDLLFKLVQLYQLGEQANLPSKQVQTVPARRADHLRGQPALQAGTGGTSASRPTCSPSWYRLYQLGEQAIAEANRLSKLVPTVPPRRAGQPALQADCISWASRPTCSLSWYRLYQLGKQANLPAEKVDSLPAPQAGRSVYRADQLGKQAGLFTELTCSLSWYSSVPAWQASRLARGAGTALYQFGKQGACSLSWYSSVPAQQAGRLLAELAQLCTSSASRETCSLSWYSSGPLASRPTCSLSWDSSVPARQAARPAC